jgi:glutamyl-tRNA synthetase
MNEIRVRFAPSPTGYLHVGGLRTALYNYLFARNTGGKFILRIEDTDRNRYVEGAVENLISTLKWAGLDFDEGPGKEGRYGPYIQSERLDIYKQSVTRLIEKKKAYYCFCSSERLSRLREEQQKNNQQTMYDKHCLTLSAEDIKNNLDSGIPYVIRMNVGTGEIVTVNDLIRGTVEFNSSTIDDQVLLKSDGYPTYHLANVIDDHMMDISHVIRGEEWLPSTPKHVLLYKAFDWEIPAFAHLPLLLNPDKTKLSKRQGDVAVEDYRNKGYLNDALVNFVLLLGWNPGDEREFFYLDEMVKSFSLDQVNKSGAVFNIEKLNWLNAEHLRKKNNEEILPFLKNELIKIGLTGTFEDSYLVKVIEVMRERVAFVKEIPEKGSYFFRDPSEYEEEPVKKRWNAEARQNLEKLRNSFADLTEESKESFQDKLKKTAEDNGTSAGKFIHPLRLAISGVGGGPGVYDIAAIIGKEKTLQRIDTALRKLP